MCQDVKPKTPAKATLMPTDEGVTAVISAAVTDAVQQLEFAGVSQESLATLTPARRRLFIRIAPRFTEIARVWRVGCLLVAADGRLWATAKTTRAARRERLGIQSLDQEERRDLAGFAFQSGFAQGTQVNYDAPLLFDPRCNPALLSTAPPSRLVIANNSVRVLWNPNATAATAPRIADYLGERIQLITEFL